MGKVNKLVAAFESAAPTEKTTICPPTRENRLGLLSVDGTKFSKVIEPRGDQGIGNDNQTKKKYKKEAQEEEPTRDKCGSAHENFSGNDQIVKGTIASDEKDVNRCRYKMFHSGAKNQMNRHDELAEKTKDGDEKVAGAKLLTNSSQTQSDVSDVIRDCEKQCSRSAVSLENGIPQNEQVHHHDHVNILDDEQGQANETTGQFTTEAELCVPCASRNKEVTLEKDILADSAVQKNNKRSETVSEKGQQGKETETTLIVFAKDNSSVYKNMNYAEELEGLDSTHTDCNMGDEFIPEDSFEGFHSGSDGEALFHPEKEWSDESQGLKTKCSHHNELVTSKNTTPVPPERVMQTRGLTGDEGQEQKYEINLKAHATSESAVWDRETQTQGNTTSIVEPLQEFFHRKKNTADPFSEQKQECIIPTKTKKRDQRLETMLDGFQCHLISKALSRENFCPQERLSILAQEKNNECKSFENTLEVSAARRRTNDEEIECRVKDLQGEHRISKLKTETDRLTREIKDLNDWHTTEIDTLREEKKNEIQNWKKLHVEVQRRIELLTKENKQEMESLAFEIKLNRKMIPSVGEGHVSRDSFSMEKGDKTEGRQQSESATTDQSQTTDEAYGCMIKSPTERQKTGEKAVGMLRLKKKKTGGLLGRQLSSVETGGVERSPTKCKHWWSKGAVDVEGNYLGCAGFDQLNDTFRAWFVAVHRSHKRVPTNVLQQTQESMQNERTGTLGALESKLEDAHSTALERKWKLKLEPKIQGVQEIHRRQIETLQEKLCSTTKQKEFAESELERCRELISQEEINFKSQKLLVAGLKRAAESMEEQLNACKKQLEAAQRSSLQSSERISCLDQDVNRLESEKRKIFLQKVELREKNKTLAEDLQSARSALNDLNRSEENRNKREPEESMDRKSKMDMNFTEEHLSVEEYKQREIERLQVMLERSENAKKILEADLEDQIRKLMNVKAEMRQETERMQGILNSCDEEIKGMREESDGRAAMISRQAEEIEKLLSLKAVEEENIELASRNEELLQEKEVMQKNLEVAMILLNESEAVNVGNEEEMDLLRENSTDSMKTLLQELEHITRKKKEVEAAMKRQIEELEESKRINMNEMNLLLRSTVINLEKDLTRHIRDVLKPILTKRSLKHQLPRHDVPIPAPLTTNEDRHLNVFVKCCYKAVYPQLTGREEITLPPERSSPPNPIQWESVPSDLSRSEVITPEWIQSESIPP